jgi:polyisoprenoid-binding protein YceI
MKKIKIILLSVVALTIVAVVSGFRSEEKKDVERDELVSQKNQPNQTMNFFVTHGHCSTPFAGRVDRVTVELPPLEYEGNPIEIMKLSFVVDPNTFNVCSGDELTLRIKPPGLFISESNEKITFTTTKVLTMGLDWYQVNGMLCIKGVE